MTEENKKIEEVKLTTKTPGTTLKSGNKMSRRGRKRVQVRRGNAYIKSSYNNTVVTLTDMNGNVLITVTAGQCGFKGPKKATPYAAGIIVRTAAEKVKEYGLKEVAVLVKGIGGGREGAVRALNANGFEVVSIRDVTPIPHNGCRKKKPRRV